MVRSINAIQPYELFGLTPNSSMEEVRRAYYRLSLVCHPDKGGDINDMRTVHNAYQWIRQQHMTVSDRTDGSETYEEKEESFAQFLRQQQELEYKIVPMDEILAEAVQFPKDHFYAMYERYKMSDDWFVRDCVYQHVFSHLQWRFLRYGQVLSEEEIDGHVRGTIQDLHKKTKQWAPSTYEGGYGNMMIPSMHFDPKKETRVEPVQYDPIFEMDDQNLKHPTDFGKAELVIYQEPRTYDAPSNPINAPIELPSKLEDYTMDYGPMDYRKAYQDSTNALADLEAAAKEYARTDVHYALEKLMLERAMLTVSMHDAE